MLFKKLKAGSGFLTRGGREFVEFPLEIEAQLSQLPAGLPYAVLPGAHAVIVKR